MSSLAQRVLENDKGAVVYRFAAGINISGKNKVPMAELKKDPNSLR